MLMLFTAATVAADERQFVWPNGARAAISLAYDDAIDSQLDHAIPALDRHGLKGTFYLKLSSETLARRLPEWRAAAARGHELANHTLFHQCSKSAPGHEWVPIDEDLDKVTVGQLAAQIRLGNTMLNAIDGKTERTFTTPCGDLKAAGEYYVPAIKSEFVAIKSIFGQAVTPSMTALDAYAVTVDTPVGVTGQQLIDVVKQAAASGTMVNFTFHGVGGDYLSVSAQAHEELVKYLAQHRDVYWTDTFISIMKYVKDEQQRRR